MLRHAILLGLFLNLLFVAAAAAQSAAETASQSAQLLSTSDSDEDDGTPPLAPELRDRAPDGLEDR